MNTVQSLEEEMELSAIARGTEALAELHARIAPRFRRAEARHRSLRYLEGLLSSVERKNGWQLSETVGESGPQGMQRLLSRADWDEEGVRDDLRAYVVEQLGEKDGVLVVDETGFLKKGTKSVGVARQYSGAAGGTENAQIGVFLLYASRKGSAFLDRALYLPEEWTQDRVRCREAGVPDHIAFATKGTLAQQMLQRAFAAGVPARWVVGDTVYGFDEMRGWLESARRNSVLAVPETHQVWIAGQAQPVGLVAALLPEDAWVTLSAGEGSQGLRLSDWAWLQLSMAGAQGEERATWLLVRRSLSDPSDRAYYRASGPAQTTLPELVHVAGRRWTIEEGLEQAKGEVGLDQYEVRTWKAWHRFVTLALLAHAFLVVMRARAQAKEKKEESKAHRSRFRVPEVHRLWQAEDEPERQRLHRLAWSHFRRQHQAVGKRCHIACHRAQMPKASHEARSPILLQQVPTLTAERWEQIRPLLSPVPRRTGSQDLDGRLTVEGILWVMQTGSTWREVPERFGPWTTVVHRYSCWCKEGRWARIFQLLQSQEVPISSSA